MPSYTKYDGLVNQLDINSGHSKAIVEEAKQLISVKKRKFNHAELSEDDVATVLDFEKMATLYAACDDGSSPKARKLNNDSRNKFYQLIYEASEILGHTCKLPVRVCRYYTVLFCWGLGLCLRWAWLSLALLCSCMLHV